ncbi:Hemolysin-type calcium-binding repeat-containing protein [Monaibacterium marinum]|uniref:Hemolysin-type calcium-binding repeat-containing protein n=1 Tax=Pontivivens marinum TaxID=1690039 RepID=A0A2C9CRW3_9RHOB|nr:Ig-like domain-containing protein [Monaibacterium marinum]SOH93972.1 Hemolysin-type calcium-binding repeat-containing protein [Monaibacterium marinum]
MATPLTPTVTGYTTDTGTPGDNITADRTLTFTGTGTPGASVEMIDLVSGRTLAFLSAIPASGNWTITVGDGGNYPSGSDGILVDGTYDIRFGSRDGGDASALSSSFVVTVDGADLSAIDLTAGSDTGSSSSDNYTADRTPTVEFTAGAGDTLEIDWDDGNGFQAVGTGTGGSQTFTNPNAYPTGFAPEDKTIQVRSTKEGVSTVEEITFTFDHQAIAPTGGVVETGSGADFTNDSTPTIAGVGEVGATIEIKLGSGASPTVASTTVDGAGNWTVNLPSLSDGTYQLTIRSEDQAGNSFQLSGSSFTVDTSAPATPTLDATVSHDTGSSNTDGITSDTNLSLSGTTEANTIVNVYIDGSLLTSDTSTSTGAWGRSTGVLAEGAHTIQIEAVDRAGNTSSMSAVRNITIDTAAPTAPTITGFTDDTGTTGDGITGDTTPTLTGTADANASVEILRGGSVVDTVTADGSGNWSFTSAALGAGDYDFIARSTDVAGNSSSSATLSIEVITAVTATPQITGISTDSGSSGTDLLTNDTTLLVNGTATADAVIEVYLGGSSIGTATADGAGDWSFDYTGTTLAEGDYAFTATAIAPGANVSMASSALNVTIDTSAPATPTIDLDAASDSGSSDTDNVTGDATPSLSGTAEANASVEIFDGASSLGTVTADGSGNWSFTAGTLTDGAKALTAVATDAAGNSSAASAALNVTIDTSAPATPTIDLDAASDSGSSDTDNVTGDATPSLSGTAEANASVEIFDGSTSLGTVTADGSGNWSFTAGPLTDDAKALTAVATDAAGNSSTASAALNVTIDTSAPTAPTITGFTDDTGTTGDGITGDTTPTLTGTADANASVTVLANGATIGVAMASASGAWSFTAPALSDGSYSFTATSADAAGNTSAASVAVDITMDATKPDDLTLDTDTVVENSAGGTFVGTVQLSEAATLVLTDDADGRFVLDGAELKVASGAVLDYEDQTSRDVTVQATDAAGNVTTTVLTVQLSDVIETFGGGAEADMIYGDAGDNNIMAGGGDDFIFGGAGDDSIDGGTGNDSMEGGTGNDVMVDAQGDDTMDGGEGDDTLYMLNGSNVGRGGAGDDIMIGGFGADTLEGGEGNDIIRADVSTSNGGNDVLRGGAGDDLLEGGLGADDFIFATNDGNDEIGTLNIDVANRGASSTTGSDFRSGVDQIFLEGFGYLDAAEAFTHVSDVGGIATFDDQGTTITFAGLTAADLSVDDFFLI